MSASPLLAIAVGLSLRLQIILELLQASRLSLVAAPGIEVAEEVGIVVGGRGVAVVLPDRGIAPRTANQEPQNGSQHRQDNHHDDPGGLGDAPGEASVSADHVHEAIYKDGKYCDGENHTEEHVIKSIVRTGRAFREGR